jgi:hypothetical protein
MRLALSFGIEGERIAGRRGRQPLLDGETQPRTGLGVGIDRIGHAEQRARVEQVHRGGEGRQWVVGPRLIRKAPVAGRCGGKALAPELAGFGDVLFLDGLELVRCERECGHLGRSACDAHRRQGIDGLLPALRQRLLKRNEGVCGWGLMLHEVS